MTQTVREVTEATPARPSSTVVMARASDGDPHVFMVRRHISSSFGDAFAFPGGVIDPEDQQVHAWCGGLGEAEANARLGIETGGLDYFSAAVRELFEETGVLLADLASLDENLNDVRDALNDGTDNWADFVSRNRLQLHCDQLYYISHWITPPDRSKRYSTRFFLAQLPPGQEAIHCGGELTGSCWASASETLKAGRSGDIELYFPTVKTLESIARHHTLDALMEWAQSSVDWGITTMVPMIINRDGKSEIVLPGDKDYPGAKS